MEITLSDLAALVDGELLRGDAAAVFSGIAALRDARQTDVSFYGNEKYAKDLAATRAGAVLVPRAEIEAPADTALIRVENPVTAFDRLVRKYGAPKPPFRPGVHPDASVSGDEVRFDPEKVSIAANAVVEAGVWIGDGTRVGPCAVIGEGARIGRDCVIGANVTVREGSILGDRVLLFDGVVIGGDGFGYEFQDGRHVKIEQLGIVRLGADVEVGANTTIDRARFGETVIGEGTKIDNLCQIAHNVVIGKHCIVVAQTGISGSARIGDYVTIAAQSGIAGHLEIGDRAVLGGRSGVIANVPSGLTVFGYPAAPMKETLRQQMLQKKLGRFYDRIRALEKRLDEAGAGSKDD
ncbi:MAG: UDP-3-O-(3-hydroxymyristoyl)glucosamine N-acyltransferase [Akkermansiaceae bacterium]|nr:UDP-3-O-(3-hydroxymyristoyl)glucosamine N-acyltransferase [Akkermansiaceae bacterium]MCP5550559.1 UDP-3-O-(3-hydroxymyristoyl)glucosamine N-acyltransferase [Akkermansiaceae bacterium]